MAASIVGTLARTILTSPMSLLIIFGALIYLTGGFEVIFDNPTLLVFGAIFFIVVYMGGKK